MPSFFKKKDREIKGKDSIIDAKEILNEVDNEDVIDKKTVTTELSFPSNWQLTTEQQYVLRFHNNQLPALKINQISLSGIDIEQDEAGGLKVLAFIRNSCGKIINLQKVSLLLLSANGDILGKKNFDLTELGSVESNTSVPWSFQFSNADLISKDIPDVGWSLAFELKPKHRLDLDKSWEGLLPEEDKKKLKQLVASVNPPNPGEVKFMGVNAQQIEHGDLNVTLLIRNGSDHLININNLPLQILDANNKVVTEGAFNLEQLEVKAHTSKPWTFTFPSSLIKGNDFNLSKWSVKVVQ